MKLENFVGMMTGHFDNKDQFNKMQAEGKIYPYAEHVNTICNDKINNLPEDFKGKFVVEKDGIWEGGSTSQFSPVMTFKLLEKFSNNFLEVSESMEVNGKRTFGYDEPIIYKRV